MARPKLSQSGDIKDWGAKLFYLKKHHQMHHKADPDKIYK